MMILRVCITLCLLCLPQTFAEKCIVPLYRNTSPRVFEIDFLTDVLLARVSQKCECRVRFHDRADFLADKPTCSILLAVWGVTPEEAMVLANLPQTVLVHASDEQRDHDTSSYSSVSAVFRQHFKHNETLAYLLDNSMKSKQRVHWIPAGYGNFKVMPAFQQSFSSRALLWSWMGSVVDKPERFQMVELMRNADATITDRGLLLVMGGQGSKSPTDYSPILYDTKFVPLPAGTSPEHFRVWETLEAGVQVRTSICAGVDNQLRKLNFCRRLHPNCSQATHRT